MLESSTSNRRVFVICTFLLFLCSAARFANGEETCSAGGSEPCVEESGHENIWKDPEHNEGEKDKTPLTSGNFNELELEIFVKFFSHLEDWSPTSDSLAIYKPEVLVSAILKTFDEFDRDNDGYLEYEEIENQIQSHHQSHEDLPKIEKLFEQMEGQKLSIFEFFKSFHKLGDGKVTVPLLEPFLRLKNLPPEGAKRVITGSTQMFIDADQDKDGKINKEEFFDNMRKSQRSGNNAVEIDDEKIQGFFDVIDKDKNEYLSFAEFQSTIPEPPKSFEESMDEIFATADLDSDGALSKDEFAVHMSSKAKEMKAKIPTDDEMAEIFEKLDVDESGSLSPTEMFALFKDIKSYQEKKMMELLGNFDHDRDGLLSMDELKEIVKGMEKNTGQKIDPKMFMNVVDQDNDGHVSPDELKAMLSKITKL